MTTQDETGPARVLPTPQDDAGIMRPADWQPVIDRIGTHPDLEQESGFWYVNGDRCSRNNFTLATPATVDALMMQHATAWLDERGLDVMRNDGGRGFFIDAYDAGDELWDRAQAIQSEEYPTRKAAVIAAVVAACEGGAGE